MKQHLKKLPTPNSHVVILDWGIGGLSVYKEFKKSFPNRSVIYFSDSGYTPYGKLSPRELRQRLEKILLFLHRTFDATEFIIACNAASTALPKMEKFCKSHQFQVTGMIDPTVRWLKTLSPIQKQKTLFIGGRRTVQSRLIQRLAGMRGKIAQPLSALVEKGILEGPQIEKEFSKIFHQKEQPQKLVLSCTHYPALIPALKKYLPQTQLIDPALFALRDFRKRQKSKLVSTPTKKVKRFFFTTGNRAQSKSSAFKAFHIHTQFKKITVK